MLRTVKAEVGYKKEEHQELLNKQWHLGRQCRDDGTGLFSEHHLKKKYETEVEFMPGSQT